MTNEQAEQLIKALEAIALELKEVNGNLNTVNTLLDYMDNSIRTLP